MKLVPNQHLDNHFLVTRIGIVLLVSGVNNTLTWKKSQLVSTSHPQKSAAVLTLTLDLLLKSLHDGENGAQGEGSQSLEKILSEAWEEDNTDQVMPAESWRKQYCISYQAERRILKTYKFQSKHDFVMLNENFTKALDLDDNCDPRESAREAKYIRVENS